MSKKLTNNIYQFEDNETGWGSKMNQNLKALDDTIGELKNVYKKTEVDTELSNKQDNLTSTQNNAINSGIDSTKVSGYDAHVSDTDIHVTISDKANWNAKPNKSTTLSGYGITDAYTKNQVDTKISDLVNSAPETLDTLNELASALGNDPNFATTVSNQIGTKANKNSVYTKTEVNTSLSAKANASDLTTHTSNKNIHVTSSNKETWDAKQDALTPEQIANINSISQLDSKYIKSDDTSIIKLNNLNEINLQEDHYNAWFGYRDGKVTNWKFGNGSEGGYADVYANDFYLNDEKLSEKLETKANDSNVVHLTNNESVSGLKTFVNPVTVTRPNIGTTGYVVKLTFKRGDEIASVNHSTFRVTDADDIIVSEVCTENYTDGKVAQILNVRNTNNDGSQVQSSISHLLDKTGEQDWFYSVRDGKTFLGTSAYKWADVNTVLLNGRTPAYDDNVVHNSGNETISGVKTFTSSMSIEGAGKLYQAFASDYVKGSIPSAVSYQGLRFYDDQKISTASNHITGAFEMQYGTDGYNKAYVGCRNYADTSQQNFSVGLRVPNDLVRSVDFLPSTTNKINLGTVDYKWADVNTELLNGKNPAYDDSVVHLSGTEVVDGSKSFLKRVAVTPSDVGTSGFAIIAPFTRGETIANTNHATFRVYDKNNVTISEVCTENSTDGNVAQVFNIRNTNDEGASVSSTLVHSFNKDSTNDTFYANRPSIVSLGNSDHKWSDVQTDKVNGEDVVTPTYLNTKAENWEFTLEDGSTVTKKIVCM